MDNAYEGQGRPRKKKAEKTDLPSHYQFALWSYEDNRRIAVPVGGVRKENRSEYPLISTTILNEGTGTETLIWLHFDLDFKRADKRWIRDGKLDWPLVAAALSADSPIILRYLSHVVRSSGGHGLSLALAISPLELIDETADVQKLAFKVQAMIIRILNHHGMGADEGARGLKRLMPNMFRPERLLDHAEFVQAVIQKRRPRVLQNLFYELRYHPALRGPNKRDRDDILWPDQRVEKPLARLYTDILDEAGPWGSVQLLASRIMSRYNISKNTVYKLLSGPPEWLHVQRLFGEGYRLTIRPSRELTDRAYDLLMERPETGDISLADIEMPEFLKKGERNHWLVSIILACKWKGMSQAETRSLLSQVIPRVPGWQKSQSLTRGLGSILRSLYRHRSALKGRIPGLELPCWLLEVMSSPRSKQLSQNFYKKGSPFRGSQAAVSVVMPQGDFEDMVSLIEPLSSPAPGGVRPGSLRAGQALSPVVDTQLPGEEATSGVTVLRILEFEIHPAGPGPYDEAEDKATAVSFESGAGNAFGHLSGSKLSGAFSKALMKASLPAAEKARILTEGTSIADAAEKERLRREWLLKLT